MCKIIGVVGVILAIILFAFCFGALICFSFKYGGPVVGIVVAILTASFIHALIDDLPEN